MGQGIPAYGGFLGAGFHASSITDLRQAAVARAYFARFHDLEVTHSQGEEIEATSGRSDPEGAALGDYDARIRGTLEGTTEGPIPILAKSLMGGAMADSVVGTTGKQHLIQTAETIPISGGRLSLEARYGQDAEAEVMNGVCKSLEFQITQAGYARWGTEILCSTPSITGSPTSATLPTMASVMRKRNTTFTFNGATTKIVNGLTWRMERRLDEEDYDVTSRQRRDTAYGEMMTTFDAELTFQTGTALKEFWGGTGVTAPSDDDTYYACNIKTEKNEIIAGGTAKHTIELDLPKVFLTGVSTPMRGKDVIRQRVTGRAIYSPSGSVYAQQLKIINAVTSY